MSSAASTAKRSVANGQEWAGHDRGDRRFGRHTACHHLLAEVGIGHNAQPAGLRDEESRDALCAHQTGGFSDCAFWTAEHRRRCYEIADADRANLRQAVDGMPGAGEPLAHGARNEYGSGGPAKNFERELPTDQVAGGVFVRPDGERRRHARQQRRVAKALSGLEDVHHLVLVAELDRAVADDEKLTAPGARPRPECRCRRGRTGPRPPPRHAAVRLCEAIEWGKRARKSAISSTVPIVGRMPESTRGCSAGATSYDHDGWAKGYKKARGRRRRDVKAP